MPVKFRNYTADFSRLPEFLQPNQIMANYFSKGLAKGGIQAPIYTPYISADLATTTWPVATAEHSAALAEWNGDLQLDTVSKNAHLPINAWILYRARFIFTADICGGWSSFG